MAEKEPHYGEEEGQKPNYGEDEASGKGKSTGSGRDTATRTANETGAEPGSEATIAADWLRRERPAEGIGDA